MKRYISFFTLLLVFPAGCSSIDKKGEHVCPQTAIIRELEQVKDYGNDTPDNETLVATALMKSVKGRCDYNEGYVDVDFELALVAGRGPRLGSNRVSFPYFVSIIDPAQAILSKELMTAEFTFDDEKKATGSNESLHVRIPIESVPDGRNFRVLMGFQLTEEQRKAIDFKDGK